MIYLVYSDQTESIPVKVFPKTERYDVKICIVRLGEKYERYLEGPEPAVLSGGTIYLRDHENNKILCIDTNL